MACPMPTSRRWLGPGSPWRLRLRCEDRPRSARPGVFCVGILPRSRSLRQVDLRVDTSTAEGLTCTVHVVAATSPLEHPPSVPPAVQPTDMAGVTPAVGPAPPVPSKHCALVMGNNDYTACEPLTQCVADAQAMSGLLTSKGYATSLVLNGTKGAIEAAVASFCFPAARRLLRGGVLFGSWCHTQRR
jgi:hypothetical protein